LERDAANARLEALSLRLQPHFLFNALNTIASTVYVDPLVADTMIGRLGDLLRQALRATSRHEVALHEELDTLDAYLTFVEARFGDRLRVTLNIDDAARDLAIPPFLLQPLVENAVRHGASIEYGGSDIHVDVNRRGDDLEIVVENAVDADAQSDGHVGTGLGASRDRLALLYRQRATLETSSRDGRFRVRVTIPASPAPAEVAEPSESYANADR
jgi:LytS/YehU family sensor histidine kinase